MIPRRMIFLSRAACIFSRVNNAAFFNAALLKSFFFFLPFSLPPHPFSFQISHAFPFLSRVIPPLNGGAAAAVASAVL